MDTREKRDKKIRRHRRVKAKVIGTSERPRLSVFRSANHIYAQLIDDVKDKVLISVSDSTTEIRQKGNKVFLARILGKLIGEKAQEKKIKKIVFDRAGYKYHGRVKALADGAREAGLEF
ncbi:MAG: 50S ribosomal protein L18 [Candidatus Wildermuthbacteria bacterium GWA2_46_15]|uniref:Large ribosomal subunit protein uL18 n=1 Tax=Candidatus Wildermuthbacteria bacterium GWA2_46_15 TaxID=1802443 RepID=A0A1G2QNX6_9BACT|nr:MAG: 50S ribosomal protein L18 [Candidatus Wildermuthbacteria bacterium GWA2_46_15]